MVAAAAYENGSGGGGGGDPIPAPTGAPVAGLCTIYGGNLTVVQWTNSDTAAHTEVGLSSDPLLDPSGREAIVAPGVSSWESGVSTRCAWFVRHRTEGGVTAWVHVEHERGCTEDVGTGTGGGEGGGGGEFLPGDGQPTVDEDGGGDPGTITDDQIII